MRGYHTQVQEVDEIEDFEALANEAMDRDAADYSPLEMSAPASRAEPTLVRCVACRGTGAMRMKWSFLWGDNCWICAGWGRNFPTEPFRGPFRANPVRVLMQGYTSQEAQ